MWRSRMSWQIFGTYGLLISLAVGVLGLVIARRVERNQLAQIEERLRAKALFLEAALRDVPAERAREFWRHLADPVPDVPTRITLIAADGRVLADSSKDPERMEKHGERPEIQAAREHRIGTATRHSTSVDQPFMYLALRTTGDTGDVAYVRVALPVGAIMEEMTGLRRLVWSAVGLTGLVALGAAFVLARRLTRPVRALTEGAQRIAAGDYSHRVYTDTRDEVGLLAQTFNHMSQRLAAQFTQLEEDRQKLRTILGSMIEGVIAVDADQRILFANERAGTLLDFAAASTTGRRLWEVVRHRGVQDMVNRALAAQAEPTASLAWDGPTGKNLTVQVAPLPGPPPERTPLPVRGAVLVLHDTTELRRLERLRQEFVANVSHEMKTPLAVISACAETLLDGGVDDPAVRGTFLERIADQANRLHQLILDLLALARIESATEPFVFEAVPLDKIVAACVEKHRTLAASKEQQLLGEGADDVEAWADEEAVRRILDNLVDNALKYTPHGGDVHVCWHAEENDVVFEVQDTGIGIPESELPRIFERFYRVDKARSRELGGTGLGLAIVKHLVQAMHGSVQVQSRPGEGSRFIVRLPRAGVFAESSQNPHTAGLR